MTKVEKLKAKLVEATADHLQAEKDLAAASIKVAKTTRKLVRLQAEIETEFLAQKDFKNYIDWCKKRAF